MTVRENLSEALKTALKQKDQITMATVRLINAAIKDRDIAARGNGKDMIGDDEIMSMMQTMIKQRKESAKTYADAGRQELADREIAEVAVIEGFLPKQMSDDEIEKVVEDLIVQTGANSIQDMGKVMGQLKAKYAGQVDMSKAGGVVKAKLG